MMFWLVYFAGWVIIVFHHRCCAINIVDTINHVGIAGIIAIKSWMMEHGLTEVVLLP